MASIEYQKAVAEVAQKVHNMIESGGADPDEALDAHVNDFRKEVYSKVMKLFALDLTKKRNATLPIFKNKG